MNQGGWMNPNWHRLWKKEDSNIYILWRMTHWNKTMSSLVFLFSKKQVLSRSGFFYCFGGLKRKPIVLHVEISIFWATPSNVIFPNRPCFCFDIQIEFQHILVTCTFLLISHKINHIIWIYYYVLNMTHKFHIWPPGLKIFAGVSSNASMLHESKCLHNTK